MIIKPRQIQRIEVKIMTSTTFTEAEDLRLFNEYQCLWLGRHLDRLRSRDGYDGSYDELFHSFSSMINYQTYLYKIDQDVSGKSIVLPDTTQLDADYLEVIDRYFERLVS